MGSVQFVTIRVLVFKFFGLPHTYGRWEADETCKRKYILFHDHSIMNLIARCPLICSMYVPAAIFSIWIFCLSEVIACCDIILPIISLMMHSSAIASVELSVNEPVFGFGYSEMLFCSAIGLIPAQICMVSRSDGGDEHPAHVVYDAVHMPGRMGT